MHLLDEKPELNITPLVDIMLVLLAILMVTTPAIVYEEHITLPDGSKTTAISNIKDLTVRIDVERNVYIDTQKMTLSELPDNIVLLSTKYDKKSPVYIKADKNLKYDDVMFVLKSIKSAGFTKVALETNG